MPISAAALRAMFAAGATPDVVMAWAEAEEAADRQRALELLEVARQAQDKKRAQQNERQDRKRFREKLLDSDPRAGNPRTRNPRSGDPRSTDVTRDSVDVTLVTRDSPFPLPPPTPPTIPLTPFDDDDARRSAAIKLAGQVLNILGIDDTNTPLGWCGLAAYLDRGIERGWRADVVLAAARKVAVAFAHRPERHPQTLGYLTKPITQAHENEQRQLPMVGAVAGREHRHGGQRSQASRAQGRGVFEAGLSHLARLADERRLQAGGAEPGEGGAGDDGGDDPGRIVSGHRRGVG